MIRRLKIVFFCFIILSLIAICGYWFWSGYQKNELGRAKEVLEIMLNAPDEKIENVYELLFLQTFDDSSEKSEIHSLNANNSRAKLSMYLGDNVNDNFVDGCLTNNDLMGFQYFCIMNGIESRINELKIIQTKEKRQYSYDAVLTITGSKNVETIRVNGMILFDDAEQIDMVTLQGNELQLLYQKT